jgi:uncharacterized protein with beta-barrel porin domain
MVVSPRDSAIYSEQSFAFMSTNEAASLDLLNRTKADGDGNTFYNMALTPGAQTRAWIEPEGSALNASRTARGPGFNSNGGGIEAGADVGVGATGRIGVAFGYDQTWLTDGDGGKGNADVFRVSLYGSQPVGRLGLSAVLTYAHAWNNTQRATGLNHASSSYGTTEVSGGVQAAVPFNFGPVLLTPAAGILVSGVSGGSFAEDDPIAPGFALSGTGENATFVSPYTTIGISDAFVTASGVSITPDAEIGFRHDQAAAGQSFTLNAADGTAFRGNRLSLDENSALLGASLTAHEGRWTAYVKYRAQLAGNLNAEDAEVGFRLAF